MNNLLYHKTKQIIFSPREYFSQRSEEHISVSIRHAAIFLFIYALLAVAINFTFRTLLDSIYYLEPLSKSGAFGFVGLLLPIIYSFSLAVTFLSAFFIKIGLKLAGVHASYSITYETMIDASVPTYVYSWVPGIGLLGTIHSLILLGYGFHKRLHISIGRSIVGSIVIPLVLSGAIVFVMVAIGAVLFLSVLSQIFS